MGRAVIDWLRQERDPPAVVLGNRELPLAIRRHPRARRMTMRLAPDGSEVRITLPSWGRTAEAVAFARSRAGWLQRQLAMVPQGASPTPGGTLAYRGQTLKIFWEPKLSRIPVAEEGRLHIGGPAENLAARLRRWLEVEAFRLMQADLAFYCARVERPIPHLRLARPAAVGELLHRQGFRPTDDPDQLAADSGARHGPPVGCRA